MLSNFRIDFNTFFKLVVDAGCMLTVSREEMYNLEIDVMLT
tara:strand:+ start:302 stop:424 length:123 start_codon:yes stop_codon:yes gene_type:complete